VSVLSRNTQGVRLIKLSQEDERLVGVERIAETDAEEITDEDVIGENTEVEGVTDGVSDVQTGDETLGGNSTDADDNGDADAGDE